MGEGSDTHRHQISPEGVFPNGTSVVNVIRFIRDYDFEARIEDVADYFGLTVEDVADAISFHATNFGWVHPLVLEAER